ncbi:Oligomycin resistance ATP-dependent permease YOR1 [Pichia kudriavzevii]|uniref:Oligomycin resistance ATP-dependent permease YOR1 n=1 Tax=Pichia kudriavzevii TaxID=4909 RepID=A0A1V2LT95_PICKU|nr:Oligomycin resistance ATP-dependent permease YOR1 [Pichia kudriavzevii]
MRIHLEKELLSLKSTKVYKYPDEDIEDRVANDERILPQKRFLTRFLWNKKIPPIPMEDERIKFSYTKNNLYEEARYGWLDPLLYVGYRRTIVHEDLYKIEKDSYYDVDMLTDYFYKSCQRRIVKCEVEYLRKSGLQDNKENRLRVKGDPNFHYSKNLLLASIVDTLGWDYLVSIIIKGFSDIATGLNTIQIRALINYVHQKVSGETSGNNGYGYAVGVSAILFFVGCCGAHGSNRAAIVGAEIRSILTKAILDKSLKLSRESRVKYPPSAITALSSNDVFKIDLAASYFPFVVCLPFILIITIVLLCVNLGGASLAGVGWFISATFIFFAFTKKLTKWRKSVNLETDSRIRYIREILNNMKMLKYYAWEIPFFNLVKDVRSKEMKIMLKIQFARNIITAFAITLPLFSAMVGFLAMYGQNHGLRNAANIFSSLTLFNILTLSISLFPLAMSSGSDALVAIKRIQSFLLAPEEIPDPEYHKYVFEISKDCINVNNGYFTWDFRHEVESDVSSVESDKSFSLHQTKQGYHSVLKEVNLRIKHGEFVVITGSIGSGKSSLLAAINGDMTRLTGSVDISGDIVLCANPWIQNATVRDNITFGLDYDKKVYQAVVECCALPSDFEILPAGDMTEIGERGVNLSGGQKARINLARAVYRAYTMSEYNIIMFDDVLSAVDAKVGKHIMRECILGLLSGKTRILATHQLSLIGEADRIIYMNGDGTIDVGTETELAGRNRSFKTLMEFQMEGTEHKEEEVVDEDDEDADVHEEEVELIRKQTTKIDHDKGKTMTVEHVQTNGISYKLISEYLKAGCGKLGPKLVLANLIIAIACTTFCMLFENVWLSFWSSGKFKQYKNGFYIGIYVMITLMFIICAIWQFCTVAYISNRSSKLLNIASLKHVMFAPMSFFDTTPLGRIINRFTKDTDVLDNEIAEQARLVCNGVGNAIGILILCVIYLPWFAILIPFLIGFIAMLFSYYQATSREVKRLEGVARSFVFSNFDEVLQGMPTIKSYSASKMFLERNSKNLNRMNESYLTSICLMRWFSIPLHGTSAIITLLVSMLCASNAYHISAANSGLLISFCVQFSLQIISSTRALGQVEQLMSSVERVCEYATELPQEATYTTPEKADLPTNWPEHGSIKFVDVTLRYRPELPFVLKNMNLDIHPGEKIGICGRTGAGKSTIMTALYRLSEPESGKITIDGVDIQQIGLFDLRSRLAIIPQDPVLFRGNIRRNLDPFGNLDDDILQKALNLASGGENLNKYSLDTFVDDDGSNFSLGERQVIALCRALLRNAKILILDEATSSVDYETDARIQSTIATGFQGCTILCIAHRLRTILNYDRILVMDKGECAEFDTPRALWEQNGIFRSMCDKSGILETDFDV